jgi:tetratricopeptide (TPR) repeat protein
MPASHDRPTGRRLDSWKEIAAFFGRAERTVKRWEAERGLPVHRVPGRGRSAVFAYSDELADWLKGTQQELETEAILAAEKQPNGQVEDPSSQIQSNSLVTRGASFAKNLIASRVAAWLLPVTLVFCLIVFVGGDKLQFKASASRHVPNVEAQDLYLKGRYFWERRTPDDLNRAVDYFTQAIVKDPREAEAYVGLADCYNLLREFGAMSPNEAYPRALSAAQRAVELDDSSAEAHESLAFATFWWLWRGATAEREFRRAIELNPHLARAHHWYATYLLGRHRFSEALDQLEKARTLEPSSGAVLADKGLLLWRVGQRTEAVVLLTQLEATEPSLSSTHDYLGEIYWEEEDYVKALAEWRHASELRHDEVGLKLANARETGFEAGGLKGMLQSELPVQKEIVDHGSGSAYDLAITCALLGNRQDAVKYMQISFERNETAMLVGDPSPMDDVPEYQKLREQVSQRLAE